MAVGRLGGREEEEAWFSFTPQGHLTTLTGKRLPHASLQSVSNVWSQQKTKFRLENKVSSTGMWQYKFTKKDLQLCIQSILCHWAMGILHLRRQSFNITFAHIMQKTTQCLTSTFKLFPFSDGRVMVTASCPPDKRPLSGL